jgi:hypothetical protein
VIALSKLLHPGGKILYNTATTDSWLVSTTFAPQTLKDVCRLNKRLVPTTRNGMNESYWIIAQQARRGRQMADGPRDTQVHGLHAAETLHSVGFQVLTAASIKMNVFLDAGPFQRCLLHHQRPEGGSSKHLRNIGQFLRGSTA